MKASVAVIVSASLLSFVPLPSSAVPIGGIEFPDGPRSFADQVVSFAPGLNVISPFDDPTLALGIPDFIPGGPDPRNHMSLGWGGELVLRFTDNALTTSGNATPDLHVFEIGPAVEPMEISISADGVSFIALGTLSGQPTSIDIDSIAGVIPGEAYTFVRIVDADARLSGSPFGGADIDAVGAISSVAIPEPTTLALVSLALTWLGFRQRSLGRQRPRLTGIEG